MNVRPPVLTARPARTALRVFEISFLTIGLALLGVYAAAQTHSELGKKAALDAFADARGQTTVAQGVVDPGHVETDQSLWSQGRIAAYEQGLSVPMGIPEGVLRIEAIGLTAPIFEGTSELVLNRGLGRIEGTARLGADGNLGIAGHRDGHLRGLKDVRVDDVIEVWTLTESRRYRITELSIVDPTDVYVLDPTQHSAITLVTCYPFYFVGNAPQRYIVRAVLEDTVVVSRASRMDPPEEKNNVPS